MAAVWHRKDGGMRDGKEGSAGGCGDRGGRDGREAAEATAVVVQRKRRTPAEAACTSKVDPV